MMNTTSFFRTAALLCGSLAFPSALRAQNLVPNPEFEEYISCPTDPGQWQLVPPWYNPDGGGGAGYSNVCGTGPTSVPSNGAAYQYAHSGNGYVGIFGFQVGGFNRRAYMETQLMDTLLGSQCYLIKIFVAPSDRYGYAINNCGVHLFSGSPSVVTGPDEVIAYVPDIILHGNPVVTDTVGWTEISGIYVAQGGENRICIGNFFDDAHTDTIPQLTPRIAGGYLIDDVSVIPLESGPTPSFAGQDLTVTSGDSVWIGTRMSGLTNTVWRDQEGMVLQTNVPGLKVLPSTGISHYTIEVATCTKAYRDTVTVTAWPASVLQQQALEKQVIVSPNPNDGHFFLTLPTGNWTARICDQQGRALLCQHYAGGTHPVSLNVAPGIYYLTACEEGSGACIPRKIIVKSQ